MYYSPVRHFTTPKSLSFDLHVLGAPPAFVLSQDQTLKILLLFTRATTSTHFFFAVFSAIQLSKNYCTGKLGIIRKRLKDVKRFFVYARHKFIFPYRGAGTGQKNRPLQFHTVIASAARADGED